MLVVRVFNRYCINDHNAHRILVLPVRLILISDLFVISTTFKEVKQSGEKNFEIEILRFFETRTRPGLRIYGAFKCLP